MASPPARAGVGLRSLPPSTVTKLGQKPSRHERSLLQVDRSTVRLRPNSVSTGTTDRQLEEREQSPHPSQTRSLIITATCGSGVIPRLRRRRRSVAQVRSEERRVGKTSVGTLRSWWSQVQ